MKLLFLKNLLFEILGHQETLAQNNVQQIIEVVDGKALTRFNSSREKGSPSKFVENVKLP